jgi:hypothetical protein
MIRAEQIATIVALYVKHGWSIRRVLLSDTLRTEISDQLENLFGPVAFVSSNLDAVWFSRPAQNSEAWELRLLSATPFALCEFFEPDDEDGVREEAMTDIEHQMSRKLLTASRNK